MRVEESQDPSAQKALLDAVAGPAFHVDRDYRYVAFNETNRRVVLDLYGTEIALGSSLLDAVAIPGDREVMRSHLDRALAGESHASGAWYGRDPATSRFYTITYAPVVRDGVVCGATAVARDDSDLRRADSRLMSEREFARTLIENLAEGVIACDAEGTRTVMNRVARVVNGLAVDADPSADWDPGLHLCDADGVTPLSADDRPLSRALRGEHPRDQLLTVRLDGADPRIMLASGEAFFDEAGDKLGAVVVLRDVTEQERIAEALRRSEQKFEAAFRASPDAININRLADGLYVDINAGFTALTGYSRCDVEGKTSLQLSVWDDPADRDRLIAGLRADGCVDRLEARFRRKDGSVTTAEMSARIVDIDGEPFILSVTRDISERKSAQAALEASYVRLERMSREVVQTLGRVVETRDPYTQGHELRVAELGRLIGIHMGMSDREVAFLETAALVHDIGKLSVPAEILTKPGRLSSVEYNLIKEHPQHAYDILKDIAFDWPIAEIVLQHHERMDGSGYPRGMYGDEAHLHARILAVADVVEAMASHRPYRPSLGLKLALDELRENPEKYDRDVVAALFELCDAGLVLL